MKAYTDIEQSKKLAEILPLESADMYYYSYMSIGKPFYMSYPDVIEDGQKLAKNDIPCWSLAALLEELNRNCWKVSLKCCGAEWDMTYDDGERYISVSADYAIDACYEMIIKLSELKML